VPRGCLQEAQVKCSGCHILPMAWMTSPVIGRPQRAQMPRDTVVPASTRLISLDRFASSPSSSSLGCLLRAGDVVEEGNGAGCEPGGGSTVGAGGIVCAAGALGCCCWRCCGCDCCCCEDGIAMFSSPRRSSSASMGVTGCWTGADTGGGGGVA